MVRDMYKVIRLSLANIRRHRKESLLMCILVMLCMALLSGAVSAEKNVKRMFPDMAERTGFYHNLIIISEEQYDERLTEILKNDERVTDCDFIRYVYAVSARIPNKNGKEQLFPCTFITQEYEEKYERYEPQSELTDAEIAELEHPIFVPLHVKDSLKVKEGDILPIIDGSKKFRFTVAGFYESGIFNDAKFIVTESDYSVLKNVFQRCTDIAFSLKDDGEIDDVCEKWSAAGAEMGLDTEVYGETRYSESESEFNIEILYVLKITEVMAIIILIAIIVMIGFRVISDIMEQIVQIGVLEALGYRSGEIALSYAAEYFLIAVAGCIAGTPLGIGIFYVLIRISENMKGYPVSHSVALLPMAIIFAGIILLVSLLALFKARSVRKYPPVTSFRKGIQDHHFGKSHFPLRNIGNNVHIRLALKNFASHMRQNIALTLVMGVTVTAVVLSFILYSFLGEGMNVVYSMAGFEMSDVEVSVMPETDADEFCKELEELPEIRKVLPTNEMGSIMIKEYEKNIELSVNTYKDYSMTENIHPIAGRFPEHENEVMITKTVSSFNHVSVGDTLRLEYNSVRSDYLITGIVTALVNSNSVYMTEDGMKRIYPMYQPDSFLIYGSEGVSTEKIKEIIDGRFGKSVENLGGTDISSQESYEERIRAKADKVISAMLDQTDTTHVEYSIRFGDTVINGNSSDIKIKSFLELPELLSAYMEKLCNTVSVTTRLFMVISAVVVMMILAILMSSEINRDRRELGIMKSMGYTSKELMFQLAFQIMPAVFTAVVMGTVLSVLGVKLLIGMVGYVPINIPAVLILDILVLTFCFGCAYISAGKIRKISVYELMTE